MDSGFWFIRLLCGGPAVSQTRFWNISVRELKRWTIFITAIRLDEFLRRITGRKSRTISSYLQAQDVLNDHLTQPSLCTISPVDQSHSHQWANEPCVSQISIYRFQNRSFSRSLDFVPWGSQKCVQNYNLDFFFLVKMFLWWCCPGKMINC